MNAIFAASFDPPTKGHEDIIHRAARVFDKLYVGIGTNSSKTPLLHTDERKFLLMAICKDLPNVEVIVFGGLLVSICELMNIGIMVRGLRATLDFESELSMAHVNRKLAPSVDTMFLVTETENSFVSSSMVKEVLRYKGDISSFVSEGVEIYLQNRELIHS
ncbi:pantetheine-phosphate adenylyltransferase [Candidatus Pacearchaeota archaeon]|jgi:pantetheine-phosphate adenylyltransferase|nr:pantetheine-phosphate adenylyltransferase [Candidatus Pacearchaeota archaeon]